LKQAPSQWNIELHNALIKLVLNYSNYDPTLYYKIFNNKLLGAISVHVDDLSVIGNSSWVSLTISSLSKCFKIGADKELTHFLSLKITRDFNNKLVFLNQSHYIEDVQDLFLPGNKISVSSPSENTFKDLKQREDNEDQSTGPYPQLIGSLLWLAQCTWPDIAFVVNRLSQFLRNPLNSHWHAALWVSRYVLSTKTLKIKLGGNITVLGYSDSNCAEDREDRRSTSGYVYRLGKGAISWKSKKQATVSLSSTKAKYKSMSDSCKESLWLRQLLAELHLRVKEPITLHVNNTGAEALAKNPQHHSCTKHIHAQFQFVRKCVKNHCRH
jgi:hypothetical protein